MIKSYYFVPMHLALLEDSQNTRQTRLFKVMAITDHKFSSLLVVAL